MQELFPVLKSALEGAVTRHVTSTGTEVGDDMKYYDDFLGDSDRDANNNTEVGDVHTQRPVSYTHLTLPTTASV